MKKRVPTSVAVIVVLIVICACGLIYSRLPIGPTETKGSGPIRIPNRDLKKINLAKQERAREAKESHPPQGLPKSISQEKSTPKGQ
jgi:hypothetical protein